ncbi:MAG: hypothetical protein HY815_28110 [Candidatus Riflebacteria bacterium]|nr:hypothetical protein [Candidatus Riflebacteria bacterium]
MTVISMATVSEVAFELVVTPTKLSGAFLFSVALCLVGGLLPALQAARLPVVDALRRV